MADTTEAAPDAATLRRLVDRLDIQDTLTKYAATIDVKDFDGLRTCFADDARASYGSDADPLEGGDAIVAWVSEAVAPLEWQHHLMSVYGVEVDGDEATALIYLLSHQTVGGVPDEIRMMTSRYHNRLSRVDGRWLISDLRLEVGWYEERSPKQKEHAR